MPFADTDLFIGLLRPGDRFHTQATRLANEHSKDLRTSLSVLIELLLIAKRLSLDPERLILNVLALAEVQPQEREVTLLAVHYLKHYNLGVLDAFHAASAGKEPIISSDHAYDRLGIERIHLDAG